MEMGAPPRVAVHVVPVLCARLECISASKALVQCLTTAPVKGTMALIDALRHGERPGEEVDVARALELLRAALCI